MSAIKHVAIFVKNIDRSVSFYQEIFGFRKIAERDGGGIIDCAAVDLTDGNIALTLIEPGNKEQMREWGYLTWGVNHIGIKVDNLDETLAKIREKGLEVPEELIEYHGQVYQKFFDPSGSEIDVADGRFVDWDVPDFENALHAPSVLEG